MQISLLPSELGDFLSIVSPSFITSYQLNHIYTDLLLHCLTLQLGHCPSQLYHLSPLSIPSMWVRHLMGSGTLMEDNLIWKQQQVKIRSVRLVLGQSGIRVLWEFWLHLIAMLIRQRNGFIAVMGVMVNILFHCDNHVVAHKWEYDTTHAYSTAQMQHRTHSRVALE